MNAKSDAIYPKKDPIVDRPVSTMRGRVAVGTLMIGYAAYLGSSISPFGKSHILNGSYLGFLLGIATVGYLFFKYTHPVDLARWRQFRSGFVQGYFLIYLALILALNSNALFQSAAQKFQADFVAIMIYAIAAGYGCLTGAFKIFKSDDNEKFKLVCGLKDFRAIQPLSNYLKSSNVHFRRQAAIELGNLGDARGVPGLLRATRDKDARVQINAIKSLVKMDDEHAVQPLIAILERGKPRMQQEAAKALGSMVKTRAVEPLIATLKASQKGYVRTSIVQALGYLEDVRAFEALNAALHDRNLGVRLAATEALKKISMLPPTLEGSQKVTLLPASSIARVKSGGVEQASIPTSQPAPQRRPVKRRKIRLPVFFRRLARQPARSGQSKAALASLLGRRTCTGKRKPRRRIGWPSFLRRPARQPQPTGRDEISQPTTVAAIYTPGAPVQPAETPQPVFAQPDIDFPVPAEMIEYEAPDMPDQVDPPAEPTPRSVCTCAQPVKSMSFREPSLHEF